jgi:competence protein ComEA
MKALKKTIIPTIILLTLFSFLSISFAQEVEKININSASAEEITQLKGIGIKYAERIIQYRSDHGPFAMPEDITKVPGIGPKTFEANKEMITTETE